MEPDFSARVPHPFLSCPVVDLHFLAVLFSHTPAVPLLPPVSQQVSRLWQALLPTFLPDEMQRPQHERQVTTCAVSEKDQHDEKPAEDFKGLDAVEKLGGDSNATHFQDPDLEEQRLELWACITGELAGTQNLVPAPDLLNEIPGWGGQVQDSDSATSRLTHTQDRTIVLVDVRHDGHVKTK